MALNWTLLNDSRQPVPIGEERTVVTIDKGAEIVLIIPESGGTKRLKESGRLWLTEQRLIFVSSPSTPESGFDSLSIPLTSLISTSFVQPTFSSNYLSIDIKPSPSGGLFEGTKAEIRLKDQAIFGFVSALEKVRERALFMKRESAMGEGEDLPVYSSPSTFAASSGRTPLPAEGVSPSTNQPAEAPPGYDTA